MPPYFILPHYISSEWDFSPHANRTIVGLATAISSGCQKNPTFLTQKGESLFFIVKFLIYKNKLYYK